MSCCSTVPACFASLHSHLCLGLNCQYPGPAQVAMVLGLKYEYSRGCEDSCRHMVAMSPSPMEITSLVTHPAGQQGEPFTHREGSGRV